MVNAYSQTLPEERACLCRHASQAKYVVEIGTFMGITAAELACAMPPDAALYCVDPYAQGGEPLRQIALRQIRRSGTASRVHMVREDSARAVASLPALVDFFFVDGDHSYKGLATDWKVVNQLLRPGGIAAFHDVLPVAGSQVCSPGAVRFFDEVIARDPGFKLYETVKSLAVLRRVEA